MHVYLHNAGILVHFKSLVKCLRKAIMQSNYYKVINMYMKYAYYNSRVRRALNFNRELSRLRDH